MFNVFGGRLEIALMIAVLESLGLIEKITDFSEEFDDCYLVTGDACEWKKIYNSIPCVKEIYRKKYHEEVNVDYLYTNENIWMISFVILDK